MATEHWTFCLFTLCLYIGLLACSPCNFTSELNTEKKLNESIYGSDGAIMFMLEGPQDNCYIDLDFVFEFIHNNTQETAMKHENTTKEVLLKEYEFVCSSSISVHFFTKNSTFDTTSRHANLFVALLLGVCSVYLEELSLIAKYGTIWSIVQSDALIHVPSQKTSCTFAKQLRIIHSKIDCVSETKFFWEFCDEVFEKVNILQLEACATKHVNIEAETLIQRFPEVQALQLNNIDLSTKMTFPWTDMYADSANIRTFISSDADMNKSVSSMGRDFRIYNSDIVNMVCLNGIISNIVINNANFNSNQSEIFRNVTGLYKVEISNNTMTEINAFLFRNQTDIKSINLQQNQLNTIPANIFEDQHHLLFLDLSFNNLSSLDRNLLKNQQFLQELHLENNRLPALPHDFLKEQIGSLKFLYLYSNPIKTIPVMPLYGARIEIIDVHGSEITGESLINLANNINIYDFLKGIADHRESKSSTKDRGESLQRPLLDLSFCNIRDIHLNLKVKNKMSMGILVLFKTFSIKGNGNPFKCNCGLYAIRLLFTIKETQTLKLDWVCEYPEELKGRKVTSLTDRDIYCPINVTDCPRLCICYMRYDFSSLIVDCRNINMSILPPVMPKVPLELWFKNTSLLKLDQRDYLVNVSVLDISENKLTRFQPLTASKLQNVTILNIENNHFTSLPVQIRYTNIKSIYLDGNPLKCDCHTKWMKAWLHNRSCPVMDWNAIQCTDNAKRVNTFVTTPDSVFVCPEIETPSIAEHVVIPSTIIGSFVFIILILSLTIYFQRFTVRVLLYMIFGVRLCYRLDNDHGDVKYDSVVIYDKCDQNFVNRNVKSHLKVLNYGVADIYDHSVIGLTFIDGIKKLICNSKVTIFFLTKNSLDNDLIITLWNITSERVFKRNLDSIILVLDKEFREKYTEENMRLYVKAGRYIKKDSSLLLKSIQYLMPPQKPLNQNLESNDNELDFEDIGAGDVYLTEQNHRITANTFDEFSDERQPDIFIVFPDVIDELHQLVRYTIIPYLLERNQRVSVLQDDFVFGEDIRIGIESRLNKMKHVVFILSEEILEDEVLQYILCAILTKAFLRSGNYLLLFTYGLIDENKMPENLKKFINSHITASISDTNFKDRMLEAITFEENQDIDNEDTESVAIENCEDDEKLI
ncbi:protein toll-like [Ruditapes philippinarum]|uniref:protein toll-like n=1 Tax=Ruditapes philippinarum TaxID=129788 RepID=UPI00295B4D42|nr:protein toll-like [Ruditapes philippinarum]